MKTRNTIILLAIIMLSIACNRDNNYYEGGFSLHFIPKECTQMVTLPLRTNQKYMMYKGKPYPIHFIDSIENGSVEAEKFILWLMTGADDLKRLIDRRPDVKDRAYEDTYNMFMYFDQVAPSIPDLELQLEEDVRNKYNSDRKRKSKGMDATALKPWPYRVTGVKDFKIVALSSLFGRPAGTTLNNFFSIHSFEPKQIISSRTKNLLWGYHDKKNVENLEQWLSMEPMAPPVVMFKLNTIPQEVPTDVEFVSILETTDGIVLRDTIQVRLK